MVYIYIKLEDIYINRMLPFETSKIHKSVINVI